MPARVYALNGLGHRAADHYTPDALVRLAPGFDPHKPLRLIIYNHGFGTDVATIYGDSRLGEQMGGVSANTVLILPEWQEQPNSRNGSQGRFGATNWFRGMLNDIFRIVPELKGKNLSDVSSIDIVAHSAGYGPTMTEIYKNSIESKIRSVVLLDALYTETGFDKWISDNRNALNRGEKRFYNIFFDTTKKNSMELGQKIQEMWKSCHPKNLSLLFDYSQSDRVLSTDDLKDKSVIFVYSSHCVDGLGQHFSIPRLYFGPTVEAAQFSHLKSLRH